MPRRARVRKISFACSVVSCVCVRGYACGFSLVCVDPLTGKNSFESIRRLGNASIWRFTNLCFFFNLFFFFFYYNFQTPPILFSFNPTDTNDITFSFPNWSVDWSWLCRLLWNFCTTEPKMIINTCVTLFQERVYRICFERTLRTAAASNAMSYEILVWVWETIRMSILYSDRT